MHCAYVKEFHERLAWARAQKYETGTRAAKAMGLPAATYLAHENGSRGGERSAERYARFFGVDLLWLLTGKGTPNGNTIQLLYNELPSREQQEAVDFLKYLKTRAAKR
jgi:transcriptional regulator with XRE-family HTH domain